MSPIQQTWLDAVVSRSQALTGQLAHADAAEAERLITPFAASINPPPNRIHNLVLASLLLDIALRLSQQLHAVDGANGACACGAIEHAAVRAFVNWREVDAARAFTQWVHDFFRCYESSHPATPAQRAARLIRSQPRRSWTLLNLARSNGSRRQLARAFHAEYGVSVRAYVHLARLHATVLALPDRPEKVDVMARAAGYRSKKDFYRVLWRTARLTPAMLRRLPSRERDALHERLRAQLFRPRRPPA